MAFTSQQKQQIGAFVQAARLETNPDGSRRYSDEEIQAEVNRRFRLDPISRLTAKFEGTAAIPTSAVAPVKDVPLGSGSIGVIGSALKDAVVGPFTGGLERIGLVEEGARQQIRQDFEQKRLDFLAADPTALRATIAGGGEIGANLVPITPAGPLGRAAVKGAGLTGKAARTVAGGAAGAAEGALVAFGDSPLAPEGERAKLGLAQTALGAATGAIFGRNARSHIVEDPDTRAFQARYFRNQKRQDPERSVSSAVASLYNMAVNSLAPIERVTKRAGLDVQGQIAAQRARVAQSISRGPVYHATRDLEGNRILGDGRGGEALMPIIDDGRKGAETLGIGAEEFFQDAQHFLVAQRQVELRGRKEVKTTGKATRDAKKRLRGLREKYGTDAAGDTQFLSIFAGRFRDWSKRAFLDPLREVGVFTDDEVARILDSNDFYAPFERALDELGTKDVDLTLGSKTPVKGKLITKGLSTKPGERLEDVFGSAADRAIRVRFFVEQQRLRNLLAEAAAGDKNIAAEFAAGPKGKGFDVWENGQRTQQRAPEDVLTALATLNPNEYGAFEKFYRAVAGPFAATFRAGSTLAIEFGVRNLLRDPWTMGIYSRNGAIPFMSSVRAFSEAFFDIKGGREVWQEFLESPASHATFLSPDRWNIARELRTAQEIASKGTVRRAAGATLRNPLLPLQKLSDGIEKFSRFGEFASARRRGKSINEAGLDASDVTLNFPRAGSIGKTVNVGEAFFNAAVQDVDKFMRSMAERPFATMLKGTAYLTVPTMASYLRYKDDPDYQNLPEWQKVLTLPVMKLENGRFVSLPKPPGVLNLIFSYLPQKATEYLRASDSERARVIDEALQGISDQTPLGYTPIGEAESLDFAINALPNVIQPIVELKADRVPFFDRPVTGPGLERLPPELRSTEFTSSPAQAIGQTQLGQALGGPVGVDHLIRGYLGNIGRSAAGLASQGRDPDIVHRALPPGLRDVPVLRNIVRAVTSSSPVGVGSKPVSRFFDTALAVGQANAGYNSVPADQQDAWLKAHPEAHPDYSTFVRQTKDELKRLFEDRQVVVDSKTMTGLQKDDVLLALDGEITLIAGEAMEVIEGMLEKDLAAVLQEEGMRLEEAARLVPTGVE